VYRVKESDGFAVIKLIVSGYRRSSVRVKVRAFKPTKFDLPAGMICKFFGTQLFSIFAFIADGSDFKIGYYYFDCPYHVNEAYIKIPIFNDNKEEGTESFAVSLSNDRRYKISDPFLAEVIIEDGRCILFVINQFQCVLCMSA